MVDLERLAQQARRNADRSRLRMASRVAVVVAGFTGVAIVAGGDVLPCLGLAAVLFVAAAGLRWWHREGVEAVQLGLAMGAVPLVAAALLPACGVECAPPGQLAEAELVCVLAGLVAGAGLALFAERRRSRWRTWVLATVIAGLTATLGCVTLGVTGVGATLLALAVSSAAVRIPVIARAH